MCNTRNNFSLNGMADSLAVIRRCAQLKKRLEGSSEAVINSFSATSARDGDDPQEWDDLTCDFRVLLGSHHNRYGHYQVLK